MKLLRVSGVGYLPTPSDYQPDIEIIENSTRNAKGDLIREIIAYKKKINCQWKAMNKENYKTLKQLRRAKSFECSYWDDETDSFQTITCYCGPVKGTPKTTDDYGVPIWLNVTANFIEF